MAEQGVKVRCDQDVLETLMAGQRDRIDKVLEGLDVEIQDVEDMSSEDYDALLDGMAGLCRADEPTSRRIMATRTFERHDVMDMTMPAGMAELLLRLGVNPLGIAALTALGARSVTLPNSAGPVDIELVDGGADGNGRLQVAPFVMQGALTLDCWEGVITVRGARVPDTAAAICGGRPIDEIVSSSVTNETGIVAKSVDSDGDQVVIRFTPGRPVAMSEAMELATEGKKAC